MDVEKSRIPGVMRIRPEVFRDARGFFQETYRRSRYESAAIDGPFIQDNFSCSARLTLRGLHAARGTAKLVQVVQGAAWDVVVDLRRESSSYLKSESFLLDGAGREQIYIPEGCLHGFLSLEDDTLLMYKQTAEYDPAQEIGVAWNDPDLAIAWPLQGREPLLSPKDAKNPTLRELGYL